MKSQIVYFILTDFESLKELAQRHHVWICNSKLNTPQIKQFWEKECLFSQGQGVTAFDVKGDKVNTFYDFISTINEHHLGDGVKFYAWNKIIVFGVDLDCIDKKRVSDLLETKVIISKNKMGLSINRLS